MSTRAKYRLFRRRTGVYFLQDNDTGRQESLRTRQPSEAKRLLAARNEAHVQPGLNLQIARAYLNATDPKLVTRTWQEVMDQIVSLRTGPTQDRWRKATLDHAYDPLRKLPLMETRPEHFLNVLSNHRPATNAYLRRMHNFALNMDWLLKAVIPKAQWPQVVYKKKRAITAEEHAKIVAREGNAERRDFYELCWHLGGSQGDVANLQAEDINWADRTVTYNRQKLRSRAATTPARITIGEALAAVLKRRPASGPLFPYLRTVEAKDRASEFRQRCHGLQIQGVTLHSYRYAWAERARACGFPLRFAQEALGHNSKAIHFAYAKQGEVNVPSLDEWEQTMKQKIVSAQFSSPEAHDVGQIREQQ